MTTGSTRFLLVLSAALVGTLLVAYATAKPQEEPPEIPPPPPPIPRTPEDQIVPPPDRPGYARQQPVGQEVEPDAPGRYWLVEGNKYKVWFTIDSWIANLMGPPVIQSKLEDAGVQSPRVWKLDDGWLVEGTWGNPSGIPDLPEDVTITKAIRVG